MATWRIGATTIHKVLEAELPVPVAGALRTDDGLVDFVETDHRVCDGVRLEAAPGHTPGPTAGLLRRGGDGTVRFVAEDLR